MMVQSFISYNIILLLFYLLVLIANKKYRLLLPSTIHTFTWSITSVFMFLELEGIMGDNIIPSQYSIVAEYIFYMIIASIVGFQLAHLFKRSSFSKNDGIPVDIIDQILKKFRFILYICLIVGILQVAFLVSLGGFESIGDYRLLAVTAKRTGYGAIAQQLSGHMAILGGFYLSLLGYKHSKLGINIKEFIKIATCVAATNMAIAGRVWILTTTLPYIIAYFYGLKTSRQSLRRLSYKQDFKKMLTIGVIFFTVFSSFGLIRNEETAEGDNKVKVFFDKFLYYTDGPKMANMVMKQYPPDTYELEYGQAEFLSKWIPSTMTNKFTSSIEDSPSLLATVKSTIPPLYYDWGYTGGIIMWGIYAFILELICLSLLKRNTILSLLLFVQFTKLLFESPIGNIFVYAIPAFQWLIIIYLIKNYIFKGIPNINKYI